MITVSDLRAGYGDGADVLQGISFVAHEREILTILGPNGCGKSTLLKAVAGFVTVRAGSVSIDGKNVTAVRADEKVRSHGFGYVPQTDNVFMPLTVLDNIRLGGRLLPKNEFDARLEELFSHYPALAAKRDEPSWALSGGERQLLSLARALVSKPTVLLLDEPSAGLSPRAMDEVFAEIAAIRDRSGITIMMVEQNASEALRIADRGLILSLGQIAMAGRAAELRGDKRVQELYLGAPAT